MAENSKMVCDPMTVGEYVLAWICYQIVMWWPGKLPRPLFDPLLPWAGLWGYRNIIAEDSRTPHPTGGQ